MPAIFYIACNIDTRSNRETRKRRANRLEPKDPFASQSEELDEHERGVDKGAAVTAGADGGRPREQWVRCAVRVSVTVWPYRLARNTTPEEAHERTYTHTLASHVHTKYTQTHAMVHGRMRVEASSRKEEEAVWKRKKPVPGG